MDNDSRKRKITIAGEADANDAKTVKLSKKQLIKKQEKQAKIKKIAALVITLVLLAAVITAIAISLKNQAPNLDKIIAIESDYYDIDDSMVAFFLYSNYNSFVNTYGDYLSYFGLSTTSSLKSQKCSYNNGTWWEYFLDQAKGNIENIVYLASAAKDAGYKLDDDDTKEINEYMINLEAYATSYNYTLENYIQQMYCKGVTEKAIRTCLEMQQLASKYYNALIDSYEYTDEDYETYLKENPADLIKYDYIYYTFEADVDDDADDDEIEDAMEAVKAKADAMLEEATDLESFKAYIDTLEAEKAAEKAAETADETTAGTGDETTGGDGDDEPKVYHTNFIKENVLYTDTDFGNWAIDDERAAGDSTVIEDKKDNSYTVYMMITPAHKDEYMSRDIRHILFTTDAYGSDKGAKAKAEEVLAEYNKGEKTEEAFSALAKKYSGDTGSSEKGGLYENVLKGDMTTEFDEWLFDESRTVGEVEIVKTTYGYHIMYYVGEGTVAWKVTALEKMQTADYEADYKALTEKYTLTYNEDQFKYIP